MKPIIQLIAAASATIAFATSAITAEAPDALVKRISADVIDTIKADKDIQAGNRNKIMDLVNSKILPHVDTQKMTQQAAGRFWRQATPEQQKQLVDAFRSMLIRIYSNAIDAYRGQTMKVQPVKTQPGATEVTVRNQYIRPGQPPVSVDYAMHKTPEGWKIYDITVEGISLVLTYRSEFEQVMRQSGVDGLSD